MSRKYGFVMVAALLVVVLAANPGFAVEKVKPAKVLRPTAFGVTRPASELTAPAPAELKGENREVPNQPVTKLPVLPGAQAPDQVMGEAFISPDSGVLAPAPTLAFDANNSDDNAAVVGYRVMPPDTEGAVGMQYYIQMINMTWSIYDKMTGAELVGPLPISSLWDDGIPGTDCANYDDGDPVALYDHGAQRWFMTQLAYEGAQYRNCLAVSATPDPMGAWYVWQYDYYPAGTLNDYPKFGVWPDGYYMTVNEFYASSGSATTVFDRTAMLAGDPNPAAQYFQIDGVQPAFPQPTNWEGGPPPPPGSPNYNIAFYDDSWGNPSDVLQICFLQIDWGTPANSGFTCPGGPGDPGYIDLTAAGLAVDSDLCGYSRNCIPQPNGQTVDTLSDRLMFPANYRNLMSTLGYEVMTVTHSVDVDGSDHAGVRWYELRNTGSGWFVADGGTIAPDSDHRWMGSSSVDQDGNIAVIYSISSSTTNPSVGYTARDVDDPPGTMQTEQVLVSGGGSQSGGNRWGDYASMHVDPDGCTFWGTAEYVNTGGSFIWDTYVGAFSMPGCTPSGFGTIDGTVYNADTMTPIEGALVEVGPYTTYTEADGSYAMNVPADTYDVTASAFGFAPMTVMGVVVPDGGTVTQDFALDPVGLATLDGYVTDAGHGWPLYSQIDIATGGMTVATVFTNPFNGYYQIDLPHGAPYDITVTPQFPGYLPEVRGIVLAPPPGQTESFAFVPDGAQGCIAPGYTLGDLNGIQEDFEGGFPPAGWSVMHYGGACDWNTTTYYARTNYAGGNGVAADADSDRCGSGTTMHSGLRTPVMDLTGLPSPSIDFIAAYNYLCCGEYFAVNVSTDAGSSWTNLLTWSSDHDAYGPGEFVSLDISAYANATTMVEFEYYAPGWDWWAEIDDVEIGDPSAIVCEMVPGAMAAGFVSDANTGDAINGAVVTNDIGGAAETMPTPDDPNIPDGAWAMFVTLPLAPDGPATRTFTASAPNYADSVVELNLVPDTMNEIDFALGAGWLEMTPHDMWSRLNAGMTEDQAMDVLNWGAIEAHLSLLAFEKAAWMPNMPMDAIGAPTAPPDKLDDGTAKASTMPERQPAAPLAAGDVLQSWGSGLGAAWGITYNQHTGMPWVGEGWGNDTIYEYTPAGAQTGTSYVAPWAPANGPADYTFDFLTGMIWVMDVGSDNCLHELDPASGYTGNTLCWGASTSERGVAYDALGDTFFVGGWNTTAVTRFDRDGNVLQVANVGLSISGLAYNPVSEHLFVIENSPTDTVTVLDPNDNYNVIGSFTIAGMGNYGGAGLGIACDGHLWVVNQTNEEVYEVDSGEAGACLSASLPWLVLTPDEGTVPPMGGEPGDMPVNAEFIADGLDHYGLVQGWVMALHDTPYEVNDMLVCFTKAFNDVAPTFWADDYIHSLAGARISQGCGDGDFCAKDLMIRNVMARWLVKAYHGPDFTPMPCAETFADVPCESTPNSNYIEQIYADGITTGCSTDPLEFCPFDPVNRAQMATFITRLAYGPEFVPPAPTGLVFSDVQPGMPGWWAAGYIEWLASEGVVEGFPDGTYQPLTNTTRAQMAKMVVISVGLPMCDMP